MQQLINSATVVEQNISAHDDTDSFLNLNQDEDGNADDVSNKNPPLGSSQVYTLYTYS